MAYTKEQERELHFANAILDAIEYVDKPVLCYEEEKEVVRKALRQYIDQIESDARFRYIRRR